VTSTPRSKPASPSAGGTVDDVEKAAAALRHRLAASLADAGYVRSPQWLAAVDDVPRHLFIPEFFDRNDPDDGSPTVYVPVSAQRSGTARWLELVYSDETWVTQLDANLAPADLPAGEHRSGVPTSSSSLPSLVIGMWEDLDVDDGHQVLEIGTGTGYSTALGCQRLGDDHVTSVEVDPAVADRARAALGAAGYRPRLIVGDGLAGAPGAAPYDRVIATCALRSVPPGWIEQSRPGTVILVTLTGWLGASGLAKLTVTDPVSGTAEGMFIDPSVNFMPARSQTPEFVVIPTRDDDTLISQRPAVIGPDILTATSAAHWLIQLIAPSAQYLAFGPDSDDLPEHLLVQSDESYAAFYPSPTGEWIVRQGGRSALWDNVEHAIKQWQAAGEPLLTDFRIDITRDRQIVAFGKVAGWDLPAGH
jgi:methyltransferase of ATP-grasp peptide maturase system